MACADSWKNDPWVTYDPWSKGESGQQNADSSDPQLVHKLYTFLIQKPSEFSKRERMFVAQQGKQINGLTLDAQSVKEALALARAEIPKLLQEQPSQDKWEDTGRRQRDKTNPGIGMTRARGRTTPMIGRKDGKGKAARVIPGTTPLVGKPTQNLSINFIRF